jgi:gamma-glutamyltranspeptidase/glutathione hydrolase
MARDYQEAYRALGELEYARALALLRGITEDGQDRPVQRQAKQLLQEIEHQAAARLARARQLGDRGQTAEAIAVACWLEADDLASYEPRWIDPLSLDYRGTTVLELPPPTQGVAALEGLGLLELGDSDLRSQVECVRLALEDAFREVRDGADVSSLLDPARLAARRAERPGAAADPARGTVYVCAVDGERTAVSFIQSLFYGFGSGVVAPGTGVVLQNRGACFAVSGRIEPGRRPYHTIIPGMLVQDGALVGPFGIMGGFLQAQAHVQFVSAVVDEGLDPQAALDRPRFRIDGDRLLLEAPLAERAGELAGLGLEPVRSDEVDDFGAGHAIFVEGEALVGGSDARKDGDAAGF